VIFAVLAFGLEAVIGYLLYRERQRLNADQEAIAAWYDEIDAWLVQQTEVKTNAG